MARTQETWEVSTDGTYVHFDNPTGYDVLINGSNHYLNFGTFAGISGYGIRDNNGVIEVKDSGGNWAPIATTGGGGSAISFLQPTTGVVNGTNGSFTFATAPKIVIVDGIPRQQTQSDGTVNWTGTTSIVLAVAPNFDIFALG